MHNLIDPYFWHIMIWFGIPVALILFWLRSGRSPLVWVSLGSAWLEAVRRQFCRSCVVAYHNFKKDLPGAVEETRGEISAYGN